MCGKSTQRLEADVTHDVSRYDAAALMAEALRLDAERIKDGLAPVFHGVLPAAVRERSEKRLAGEGESSN